MKSQEGIRDLLILYDSDELTAIERQQVEDLLKDNPKAQQELDEIRKLHQQLREKEQFEPDENRLDQLRERLSDTLWEVEASPSLGEKIKRYWNFEWRPMYQLAFTLTALVIGVLIGRQFFQRTVTVSEQPKAGEVLQSLINETTLVSGQSSLAPYLANVSKIRIDPATNQIELEFNTVNEVSLRGSFDDPAIQRVLAHAMRAENQAGLRLKAIKAINNSLTNQTTPAPDNNLIDALLYLLTTDSNDGVRLKVVQVLKAMPFNQRIKETLIQVLLRDPNSAIRIAALEALSKDKVNEATSEAFQAAAVVDSNEFVRLQARQLLEQNAVEQQLR